MWVGTVGALWRVRSQLMRQLSWPTRALGGLHVWADPANHTGRTSPAHMPGGHRPTETTKADSSQAHRMVRKHRLPKWAPAAGPGPRSADALLLDRRASDMQAKFRPSGMVALRISQFLLWQEGKAWVRPTPAASMCSAVCLPSTHHRAQPHGLAT